MANESGLPGLALRQRSAARLAEVLGGADFVPFSAAEFADGRDRSLANRLVTLALRRHGHLNAAIGKLLERGMPKKSGSFEAELRLGLTQLLYLPEMGEHSAVHLAVEAVKRDPRARHLAGLMNAALRRAQAEAETLRSLPVELLFPEALRREWISAYGADAVAAFGAALLAGAPLDLTLRDDDPALVAELGAHRLIADSVRVDERDRPVAELLGYAEGRWWVQDAAAAVPARLLGLPAGSRVLDLCAAPGGKTAQLVKAGYRVTALDRDADRLARLRDNLARLGYAAETIVADAADFTPAERFDGVLLDAPCSATGTFRRHPEVLWHRDAASIARRAELQRRLIANAARCLNPGGVLVYCVCSLQPGEGEEQRRWVEETLPGLRADPIDATGLAGLAAALDRHGALRTHPALAVPGDKGGTLDGFFIARFRRR